MVQASRRKYHHIYKTTCIKTNKFYIGMHSTDNLDDGYLGSGKRLWRSIRKHGKENHNCEILEFLNSREELKIREAEIVNEELLGEELCMNLTLGGGGGFYHISRELHSENSKYGLARIKWLRENDLVWREKLDKKHSDHFKKLHSENRIKYDTFTGKSHSDESIQKMKESLVGSGIGEKNSQYGTCWIYSSIEKKNLKINKTNLDQYISDGWVAGRKVNISD